MYKMTKLKKMRVWTMKNPYNLDVYQIINRFLIQYNFYVVSRN